MSRQQSRLPDCLEGIRILDLSRVLAGPYCTQLLGDYGARVIKVERPGEGDLTRSWGPPWQNDQSAYYLCANRNKRSLTLNLDAPQGRSILHRLLQGSDILIENFKPGTMARWGLAYEDLREPFPALVYCSISAFGSQGPWKDRGGFDFMIQACSGLMSITGPAEGPSSKVGVAIADLLTALHASTSILAALQHRNRTGEGQWIDLALLDSAVASLVNVAHNYFATNEEPGRYGNGHPNIVPYETFAASDGEIALAVGTDQQFLLLCEYLAEEELARDPRFRSNARRVEHRSLLQEKLAPALKKLTVQSLVEGLSNLGVPVGAVNSVGAILNHPQVAARSMIWDDHDPEGPPLKMLGVPAQLSRTPARPRKRPPRLGEHTDEILRELGYTPREIRSFRKQGCI